MSADACQERTFLYLSDIHFVKDFSGESAYDLDDALEQDAAQVVKQLKRVDGILLSGDAAWLSFAFDIASPVRFARTVLGFTFDSFSRGTPALFSYSHFSRL
ncbi:MAG: hypothetical protein DMG96_02465 [Acidobacteria bacterium]|nr:MAG: hypothetical protein DMG96_02465 [Acidobacteriota bacterium]